jgi:hypothetical protein
MQQPNWFDSDFEVALRQANAEQALAQIAKSPRIRKAISDAIEAFELNSKKPGWTGPSKTQTVRKAIVDVLQATT